MATTLPLAVVKPVMVDGWPYCDQPGCESPLRPFLFTPTVSDERWLFYRCEGNSEHATAAVPLPWYFEPCIPPR